MDQVYGFRVAIHLLEPPLTETPGRSPVHEPPAPAAAPHRAKTARHCAGLRAEPHKARRRSNGWRARVRGIGCRYRVGSVSGALQEHPAIDAGRPWTSTPQIVSSGPQGQGPAARRVQGRGLQRRCGHCHHQAARKACAWARV